MSAPAENSSGSAGAAAAGANRRLLSTFEPAARDSVKHGGRYSRFVGVLKITLLLAAAGLIATVVLWMTKFGSGDGFQFSFASLETSDGGELTMINPRFTGSDRHDRPYTVWADTARLDPEDHRLVYLDAVRADLALETQRWITLRAEKGIFHQGRMSLHMSGDIAIFTSDGYRFETATIYADLSSGFAVANQPLTAEGPFGTVRANSMKIFDHGRRLVLEGQVKVRLQRLPKER